MSSMWKLYLSDKNNNETRVAENTISVGTINKSRIQEANDRGVEVSSRYTNENKQIYNRDKLLPEGITKTTLYMNGSLRSWIHYIELRGANGTQKEHMEIAHECAKVISKIFPLAEELKGA